MMVIFKLITVLYTYRVSHIKHILVYSYTGVPHYNCISSFFFQNFEFIKIYLNVSAI